MELNIDKALSLFKLAADRGTRVCAGSWSSLLPALAIIYTFHCGWVGAGAAVAAGYVIAQYNLANCLGTGANGIYEKNLTTSACLYLRSSSQGTSYKPLLGPLAVEQPTPTTRDGPNNVRD